ncbi:MAG: response regulator transcription factor [Pseudobdellovibrio sp.]
MKIFILEDDPKISQHLNSTLTSQGWSVQSFSKIQDIISALGTQNDIDVIILDRLLPDGDSVNSLQNIKNKAPQARIVILSSLDFPKEKAKWLSEGADEYMSKPFFSDELVARINLLKARAENKPNLKIEIKDLIIDRVDRNIYCKGQKLDLSAKEYSLLLLLSEKPGRVFNKFQILEHVWGYDSNLETNVVESTLNHLRRKLETTGSAVLINNKRNLGYWIEA